MCGVFGFVAAGDRGPSLSRLEQIAEATESRGRDAFGFAWIDGAGRLRSFRSCGRVSDHLGLLAMAREARMLIGHCRFATDGSPADNINNHPHPCDGGWIVHNGMLPAWRRKVMRYGFAPSSECDSEVLALAIEHAGGTMLERCWAACELADTAPLALLGLWKHPRRLIAIRQGNPLCFGRDGAGNVWLASLPAGVPGAQAVEDDSAIVFSGRAGRVIVTTQRRESVLV